MTSTTINLAAGTDALTKVINNLTGNLQTIGGAVLLLVVVVVAVAIGLGAFKPGGGLREHMGKVAVVAVSAMLMGGGAVVVPMITDIGKEATSNVRTTTNDEDGAN